MRQQDPQRGISTFATIGAFVGLGVVLLGLFLMSGSPAKSNSSSDKSGSNGQQSQADSAAAAPNNEAPFIRIPQNSLIYQSTKYDFMFAYPDGFDKLTENNTAVGQMVFSAESALADKKPVGPGTAILNGRLGAYVYSKDNFKILVADPDVFAAPTKTGNDITWKIVSRGGGAQNYNIGDAFAAKSVRSQTSVTVFDFSYNNGNKRLGRWVFASGDNFVLVALPFMSKPDGSTLSAADLAAYDTIGNNLARTVRIPSQ